MARNVSMYMIKNPICVSLTDSAKDIVLVFKQTKKSHLLVENNDGLLQGVISKQDILKVMDKLVNNSPGKTYSKNILKHTEASEIMTAQFMFVKPTDSIDYAVELLLQNDFHCLPVMDDGVAVGVISANDLLKAYYQEYG